MFLSVLEWQYRWDWEPVGSLLVVECGCIGKKLKNPIFKGGYYGKNDKGWKTIKYVAMAKAQFKL